MTGEHRIAAGPDLARGIRLADLPDGGKLVGHCGDAQVLLVRRGEEIFAVDAQCTHYNGPLVHGLVTGETVRCPWHHGCFSLRTGEALRAPAFSPLACWRVEQRDGQVFVVGKRKRGEAASREQPVGAMPEKIVIVGGGAAGFAAAEMLRREQYIGSIVMLSDDASLPVDRPNLSKDYLAGKAPEEWLPLRGENYYFKNQIDLRLGTQAVRIEPLTRKVILTDGYSVPYDRLLLATGSEPVRLAIPGADQPHVHTLHSLADCRAIIGQAATAQRAIVLGASFIGLEVAAALRARGVEVHVVAPDKHPMERVLGSQMGNFIRTLHEQNGVVFHLEDIASSIDGDEVKLRSGKALSGDLVVAGIGVRPRTGLAESAGLTTDHGVVVDGFLETSEMGIFAAGDIARWPDQHSGENIRVEHWVVAERQGQTAALNMLGRREKFNAVPFFWSQHYDVRINYVGHAERWDEIMVEGDIAGRDCLLRFKRNGRVLAAASVSRDIENLMIEMAMEHEMALC